MCFPSTFTSKRRCTHSNFFLPFFFLYRRYRFFKGFHCLRLEDKSKSYNPSFSALSHRSPLIRIRVFHKDPPSSSPPSSLSFPFSLLFPAEIEEITETYLLFFVPRASSPSPLHAFLRHLFHRWLEESSCPAFPDSLSSSRSPLLDLPLDPCPFYRTGADFFMLLLNFSTSPLLTVHSTQERIPMILHICRCSPSGKIQRARCHTSCYHGPLRPQQA